MNCSTELLSLLSTVRCLTVSCVVHNLHAEADALELKQEFARRLGEQQRQIDVLKASNQPLHDCSSHEACIFILQQG